MQSTHRSGLLVFGPQALSLPKRSIDELRTTLSSDRQSWGWVNETLATLSDYWDACSRESPSIRLGTQGRTHVEHLASWLTDRTEDDSIPSDLPNICLTPLVVLIQLTQFWRYVQTVQSGRGESADARDQDSLSDWISQQTCGGSKSSLIGFCTGLLSAFAVAVSDSQDAFRKHAAVVLRLAMLVGAFVDGQEESQRKPGRGRSTSYSISWSPKQKSEVDAIMERFFPDAYVSVLYDSHRATIIISKEQEEKVLDQLRAAGVLTVQIGLQGRFHNPESIVDHDVNALAQFCDQYPGLQLPEASQAILSAYTNTMNDHDVGAKSGSLHRIALRSILTEKCDWYGSFETASLRLPGDGQITVFGLDRCIPPSSVPRLASRLDYFAHMKTSRSLSQASSNGEVKRRRRSQPGCVSNSSTTGQSSNRNEEAIAVVGMSIKVAGADDFLEFGQMLKTGESQHKPVEPGTLMCDTLFRETDASRKWYGNFIRDRDAFDHKFFRHSADESASMDPQQRLFLQAAYQAVEQSGHFTETTPRPDRDNVGLYVGMCASDYEQHLSSHEPSAFAASGAARSFVSANVSHHFGWTGPSMTFDTACSASTVAIHNACRDLIAGDCSAAVAGGVSTITDILWFQNLAGASFLSPTGQCKPFDSGADGYCRAEGIACVFLKRLSDAVRDGNPVWGCIPSTGVQQNQNCTPLFVPNSPSLSHLFKHVIHKANLDPRDINLVEAHGTGTPVGDPVEYESIKTAIGGRSRSTVLPIGSVKGHVGHTEGASGAVSLIKVLSMMHHGFIPPQASFRTLSPEIKSAPSDMMEVSTSLRPWADEHRAALINNYGASGSNASMVITSYQQDGNMHRDSEVSGVGPRFPFRLSALDDDGIKRYSRKFSEYLSCYSNADLASISFNVCRGSNPSLPKSLTFSCDSLNELKKKLVSASAQSEAMKIVPDERPVILCFGGQVSTHIGLDRELFDSVAILRHHLYRCDDEIKALGLSSIFPDIFSRSPLQDVVKLQTALFAMQYSCAMSWMDCGLDGKVKSLIGHSFGEITALCVSGILSLRDAVKVVAGRAQLIRERWGPDPGVMIAVQGREELVRELLAEANGKCCIACYNGPQSFTLAGPTAAAEDIMDLLVTDQRFKTLKSKKLNVTTAFHSSLVEPLMDSLEEIGQEVTFNDPIIPLESATPTPRAGKPTAKFIPDHMRQPVYFNHALRRLTDKYPAAIFVEAGSSSTIAMMAKRALADHATGPQSHFQDVQITNGKGLNGLTDATVALWNQGLRVRFWSHHPMQTPDYSLLSLPPYQFEKSRHWTTLRSPLEALTTGPQEPADSDAQRPEDNALWTFLGHPESKSRILLFRINTSSPNYLSYISGHTIAQTAPICPATLEIDMAIEALRSRHPEWKSSGLQPTLYDLVNHSPLCVDPTREVHLSFTPLDTASSSSPKIWEWTLTSHTIHPKASTAASTSIPTNDRSDSDTRTHATARLHLRPPTGASLSAEFARFARQASHTQCLRLLAADEEEDVRDDGKEGVESLHGAAIYRAFRSVVDYGEQYRGLRMLVGKGDECAGRVKTLKSMVKEGETWLNVPRSDSFTQAGGLWANCMGVCKEGEMFIASGCEIYMRSPEWDGEGEEWDVYARHSKVSEKEYMTDLFVFEPGTGKLVEMVIGIKYASVARVSMSRLLRRLTTDEKFLAPGVASKEKGSPREDNVVAEDGDDGLRSEETSARELMAVQPAQAGKEESSHQRDLATEVRQVIATVTGLEPHEIGPDADLADLGIDSLMGIEVAREVENVLHCKLSMHDLMEATTFGKFVLIIAKTLGCSPESVPADATDDALVETPGLSSGTDAGNSDWSDNEHSDESDAVHFSSNTTSDHENPVYTNSGYSISKPEPPVQSVDSRSMELRRQQAEEYVTEYTTGWSNSALSAPIRLDSGNPGAPNTAAVVIVTGATGSLGSHLVASLAENPSVKTVVCINRPSHVPAEERQDTAFQTRGITLTPSAQSKLRIFATSTSQPNLGLPPQDHDWLTHNATHIIHNAWPMSATRPLQGFVPQFRTLRNLLDLTREISLRGSTPHPSFQLVSSIGVVGQSGGAGHHRVRETRVGLEAVLPNGYCEAKWVCERMLDETLHAHPARFGGATMVVRPGQIAGSSTSGYWNPVEHFAFLVKSAQVLRAWPDLRGRLQWVPVDVVAEAMVELLGVTGWRGREAAAAPVYHVDNPVGQPWEGMTPVMAGALGVPRERIVPLREWVELVRRSELDPETENPAAMLADFFDFHFERMSCGGIILDTKLAQRHSPTLAATGPVSAEEAQKYIHAWKQMGFLHA